MVNNKHDVLKWLQGEFKPPYPIAGIAASNQYAHTFDENTAIALISFVEAQRDLPDAIKDTVKYDNAMATLEEMLAPIQKIVDKAAERAIRLEAGRQAALKFDNEFTEALSAVYDTFVEKAQKIVDEHNYHVDNQWFYQLGQGVQEIRKHESYKKTM